MDQLISDAINDLQRGYHKLMTAFQGTGGRGIAMAEAIDHLGACLEQLGVEPGNAPQQPHGPSVSDITAVLGVIDTQLNSGTLSDDANAVLSYVREQVALIEAQTNLPGSIDSTLNAPAQKMLHFMASTYCQQGYLYSGCVSPEYVARQVGISIDVVEEALKLLIARGYVQQRNCDAYNFELTVVERARLIDRYNLSTVWQQDQSGRLFSPNGQHGEVTEVKRELAQRASVVSSEQ